MAQKPPEEGWWRPTWLATGYVWISGEESNQQEKKNWALNNFCNFWAACARNIGETIVQFSAFLLFCLELATEALLPFEICRRITWQIKGNIWFCYWQMSIYVNFQSLTNNLRFLSPSLPIKLLYILQHPVAY